MRRLEKVGLPLLAAAALLLLWQLGVVATRTKIFPSPVAVVRGIAELAERGVLVPYVLDSLRRVSIGYSLAVAIGLPAGLLLGWYRPAAEALNPLIQMLRPISPLAWMPLAVIWFGVGESAPIFLIFLSALFPVTVAAMNGVSRVPKLYLLAGQNFGLRGASILARVVFPAALPQVLTGLRLALGVAWLVLVAAEMIAVSSGLGYLIIDARNAGKRYDLVVAGMLLIGAVGLLLDALVSRVEHIRSVRWGFLRD